jgi:hypothetical protein
VESKVNSSIFSAEDSESFLRTLFPIPGTVLQEKSEGTRGRYRYLPVGHRTQSGSQKEEVGMDSLIPGSLVTLPKLEFHKLLVSMLQSRRAGQSKARTDREEP